jgi:hypothetical protein
LKAGLGRFIGALPLAVEAFADYPSRTDRTIDPISGTALATTELRPAMGRLDLPRALAGTVQIERQLTPGLDAQIGVTLRRSDRLAVLDVPPTGGWMPVQSTGAATYREFQIAVRRTWKNDQQLFVSYVRSAAVGDLNDFAVLFQTLDVPIIEPGGRARTPFDARHRWIAWSTFNLPRRIVVSPVLEVRSGFPYSTFNQRYNYMGAPNGQQFPLFMALDLVAYKTFTVRQRSADLGIQLFNATAHFNPRDVYPVADAPRSGEFTNSVGPILRGFMLIKW